MPAADSSVGRPLPRREATAKVTGRAHYVHSMSLPGMLHGKIVRSTVAHGRILSIDTSAALACAGVHAVITGSEVRKLIPEPFYGPAFHDQPILAIDKVRYVGEPVAVVLAADPHVAESAAQLVLADYEELPAVFDEVAAVDTAAIVHEVLKPAGTFPDLKHLQGRENTNIALDYHLCRGDVEQGFADADHIFEHQFTTQPVLHVPLEPLVSIAAPAQSSITLYSATQSPSFVRIEIARLLGWSESQVQVKVPFLGGGFGAKLYIKLEALVTALALIVGSPVKIALSMEEQFYTITKHATTFKIKSGVSDDGRILARRCEVWWNTGAYADIGPRVTQKSGFSAAGPYDIDHVQVDSYSMYTNRPPAGALRGFGVPQLVWAYESHTDMIARALKLDSIAFRRLNLLRNGRPQATGTIIRDAEFDKVLTRLAECMQWDAPFDNGNGGVRHGRGVAVGFKACISPTTSVATLTVNADGSCSVQCSTVDMGQGSDTAYSQIVSDVLGIPLDAIKIVHPDTDVTPYDMATLGSRSLFHMGNAIKSAAEDARDKLAALASELDIPDEIPLDVLFRSKYGMQAGNVVGMGSYIPDYTPTDHTTGLSDNVTPFWMVGGTGAEVSVDTETGHVTVTRLTTVADVGTPINPKIVETQLSGAALMQLGCTLYEEMEFDAGQVTNASLADYKIPGMRDVPAVMVNETVDARHQSGPFGAKGVGETGTFGVSPAIANAIDDAVGVRLTALPLKPEALYRALRANQGKPLEDD